MAKNPNLPEDILVDIFSRLPARSVGKCRCLSTLWRSRLSNSSFLNLHVTRKSHQHLFLVTNNDALHTIEFPMTEESVRKNLCGPKQLTDPEMVGSVNGLVLIAVELGNFILMNPITREQVFITGPSFNCDSVVHGFGYDISSNDYKIVSLSDDPVVFVYSVKEGVWVKKDNFPSDISDDIDWNGGNGVFLNGAIHWIGLHDKKSTIVAFDLHTEVFRQVSTPADCCCDEFCSVVFVLWGCLCFIEFDVEWMGSDSIPIVWMMTEYGLEESWDDFILWEDMPGECYDKPLCHIGEDKVVLVNRSTDSLLVYNVEDYTLKVITQNDGVCDGCAFVESLVSPKLLGIGGELDLS